MSSKQTIKRRKSRQIAIGGVTVGGDAPIRVQSMTNTKTSDVETTVAQIKRLVEAGCELVRVSVPDRASATALAHIKQGVSVPLIADIHFNWRMGIEAIEAGADAVRVNPGNIEQRDLLKVVEQAGEANIPIRIGVNAGSLKKDLLKEYGRPTPEALVRSALETAEAFEKHGFGAIKISVKASSVKDTIDAYRLIAGRCEYPLHVGVSEAGPLYSGTVKSAIALGVLLSEGIGDTIRVSLTADPVEEVRLANEILRAVGQRGGIEIISCPTCARCEVDLIKLVNEVERRLNDRSLKVALGKPATLKVALMGCVVNGPGEAGEADVGIAAGRGSGVLLRRGNIVRKIDEKDFVSELLKEVDKLR